MIGQISKFTRDRNLWYLVIVLAIIFILTYTIEPYLFPDILDENQWHSVFVGMRNFVILGVVIFGTWTFGVTGGIITYLGTGLILMQHVAAEITTAEYPMGILGDYLMIVPFGLVAIWTVAKRKHRNKEKNKRAAELVLANKELQFQNAEKDKRAAELVLANKELQFQHDEKDKRAAELVLTNKELQSLIEESRKMQEHLMAQDRLASVGQLVAGVAHEIKNPLSGVIGFSDLLLTREVPRDIAEDLKIINDEAKRVLQIVNNLLTFARQQPEGKAEIQINEQVQRVLALRAHEQMGTNINVISRLAPDLPPVMGNNSQLLQVLFNIVVNAEQAMVEAHNKGTLTITTERAGDGVRISIADDGPGISPENMRKLFIPFFTTKAAGKGNGLGLSICYGIVTGHGGRIYAKSEPGNGATFIIELPGSDSTLPAECRAIRTI